MRKLGYKDTGAMLAGAGLFAPKGGAAQELDLEPGLSVANY